MQKIYWRPRAVSRPALMLIALVSIVGLMAVERFKIHTQQPYTEEKLAAAKLAAQAFGVIKAERIELGPPIDSTSDPTESGLVGLAMSPVTSDRGQLSAKQTSVNPNFAAVIVQMLKEADVQEGDRVAIGCSGSFPALNICAYAACETLKLEPLVICSASASEWGANVPALMWPDMERLLNKEKLIDIKSIACSIGGVQDRGFGLTEEGIKLVKACIERNGLEKFHVEDAVPITSPKALENLKEDFTKNIDERMAKYKDAAEGMPIKAYINIGGGTISVGKNIGKRTFHPGLNKKAPPDIRRVDGVMPRFSKAGVPVIHLVHINSLANKYTLPLEPPSMPSLGEGGVFKAVDYSKPLVAGVLAFILLCLYGFIRTDVGFRILRTSPTTRHRDLHPEPMV
jgi:poly-gamma-glutamate system protein